MAIDTNRYYYLFDPAFQIENNAGKPVVGGHVEVFVAGTDEQVITYQDWDGTRNPFKIPLRADGRAVILVEVGTRYDAYAYDSFNNLVFSRLNILPMSDASINGLTRVYHDNTLTGRGTSTDPLKVNAGVIAGSVKTQSPIKGNGSVEDPITVEETRALAVDNTLSAASATINGVKSLVLGVSKNALTAYMDTEDLTYDENEVIVAYKGKPFASVNDQVLTAGTNIDITNNIISVTGLNSYATTAELESISGDLTAAIDNSMKVDKLNIDGAYIVGYNDMPFSAVGGGGGGTGGKTYTGVYPINVNNISNSISVDGVELVAGNNIDINDSNVISVTGLEIYQTTANMSQYAKSSDIPSLDGYAQESKFNVQNNEITGYNGTAFYVPPEYVAGANIRFTDNIISVTGLDVYQTTAGMNDYAKKTDIPTTAGFATTAWVEEQGYLTAHQDISNKLDTTAYSTTSGMFLTAHQSLDGYATTADLNAYQTTAGMDQYAKKTDIPTTAGLATTAWVENQGYLTAHQDISNKLDTTAYSTTSGMFLTAHQDLSNYATKSEIPVVPTNVGAFTNDVGYLTAHQDISNKLDTTAFSTVSGTFLTAHQSLAGYATESFVTNITNNKLDTTAFGSVSGTFLTAHQSLDGYATTADLLGKMDESKLEIKDNKITGYNGTAFAGQGGGPGGPTYTAGNNIDITNDIISVTGLDSYATTGSLTAYLPKSAITYDDGYVTKINNNPIHAYECDYASTAYKDRYGNNINMSATQGKLTFGTTAYNSFVPNDLEYNNKLEFRIWQRGGDYGKGIVLGDTLASLDTQHGKAILGIKGGTNAAYDAAGKPNLLGLNNSLTAKLDTTAFSTVSGTFLTAHQDLSNYALKSEIPTVPTNVGAFTNDVGYLTAHQSLAGYATEAWVNDQGFAKSSEIPTIDYSFVIEDL